MPFLRSCGSFPAWPLTGLYRKELERLKGCVCAGTPWLPGSLHVNTLIHLPLSRSPNPNICLCTYLIFMMTKANIACWIEWHRKVKLWAWPERAGRNVTGVCEGVNVCVWSPERANPHHRSSTHCSVCPETHMQIWRGSVNNLLEFAHYRFASLNFNLSPNRPCWWERACGFKRRGGVLAFGYMVVSRFMCIRIHCAVCVNVSLHLCIYAVRVHAFQWGDPLGRTVLRAGLWSGSPQMRSCFLWNDLPHNWFRLKDCMTK